MIEFMKLKFNRFQNPVAVARLERIARNMLFFTALLTMVAVMYVAYQQGKTLKAIEELGIRNQEGIEAIKSDNKEQHKELFSQIQCIAEASIAASKGNDVTIKSLKDCEFVTTPKSQYRISDHP